MRPASLLRACGAVIDYGRSGAAGGKSRSGGARIWALCWVLRKQCAEQFC
jgi:hypothetical protein